jgi:hypothetical protein
MVVITLLEKSQLRIACNALLDQCCTDKCYIIFDLLQMLLNATKQNNARTFTIAQCFMSWCHAALSFHKSNFLELMVTPKQCFADLTYVIIIGQESMRLFVLDMSVHDNTLSWGCLQQCSLMGKRRNLYDILGLLDGEKHHKAEISTE